MATDSDFIDTNAPSAAPPADASGTSPAAAVATVASEPSPSVAPGHGGPADTATTGTSDPGQASDLLAAAEADVRALAEEMADALSVESTGPDDMPAGAPAVVGEARVATSPADARTFTPPELDAGQAAEDTTTIDLLDDVQLEVKVELGRTVMYIDEVLRLRTGAVVELEKLAGDPVDVYINDRLVARGEVLVLNDNFCVRINDIRSPIPELEHG